MKKVFISIATALSLTLSGCMMGGLGTSTGNTNTGGGDILGSVLGGVLGSATGQNALGGLLDLVIGSVSLDQSSLVGTWNYNSPGCAFTSENLLTKAGGAAAAGNIKSELMSAYSGIGISSANTSFTFTQDNQFSAKVNGIPLSGTYTYDSKTSKIKLQTMLFSTTGYVTRTSNGIGLMFESKKLISALTTAGAFIGNATGNSAITTVSNLAKQFDGVRLGFDLSK